MHRTDARHIAAAPHLRSAARLRIAATVFMILINPCARAQTPATTLTFAIASNVVDKSGDAPLRQMLDAIGRERDTSMILYDGNFKSDIEPCRDSFYEARKTLFDTSRKPVVLIPGGNDWSTCGTSRAGSYDPVERLDFVRQTFFGDATSLGQSSLLLIRESDVARFRPFRENVRWQAGGVGFIGLNAPAPNNHFLSAGGRNGEFEDRSVANAFWLEHAAESARRADTRALVIVMQGDPDFSRYERRDRFAWLRFTRGDEKRDGFLELKRSLVKAAELYRGPVIVIHGSTAVWPNGFHIDQPLHNDKGVLVSNFTRIEVNLKKPQSQWLEVAADFSWRSPFRVRVRDVVVRPADTPAQQAAPASQPLSVEDGAPGPSSFFQEMQPVAPQASAPPAEQPASNMTPASAPTLPPMLNPPAQLPPILPSTPGNGATHSP